MKRSAESKSKTIETFGKRARLIASAEKYRRALGQIVEAYDMRAELFTNDADCAASLADRARSALNGEAKP